MMTEHQNDLPMPLPPATGPLRERAALVAPVCPHCGKSLVVGDIDYRDCYVRCGNEML